MMRNRWVYLSLMLCIGSACAVEPPNPSLESRVRDAELVIVVDEIELLPRSPKEFDKYYRVSARAAGVLKGKVGIGDRIEVVVDATISEQRNSCCIPGHTYVLFLKRWDDKYVFVGSPLGAIPVEFQQSEKGVRGN